MIMRTTLCILAAAATFNLSAEDWPTWRGLNRDGISKEVGLLKAWPATGPELAWKATGAGVGFSSVSVAAGRIFTMGDGDEGSYVRCFSEKDGKPVWVSAVLGKAGGSYKGTRCTPTVDGDLVYALGQFGDFVCLRAVDGKEVWRKSLQKDFGGNHSGWQYTESPLVDGDKVVCTPGGPRGTIVALNKKSGELIWQSKEYKDGAQYASLIAADFGGRRQYIQLTAQSVAGVDAETGNLLWRAARQGQTATIPTPIFSNGLVYVTSGYGVGCDLFKVSAESATFTTSPVYKNKEMVNHHGGVILLGENLYGFSDSRGWLCQNFKTGEQVWANRGVGKGAIAYADGHFYCRSEGREGTVSLIEASPKGYAEKGRFNQPDRSRENSWAHPVVANGKLYLRDQDILLCYDIKAK